MAVLPDFDGQGHPALFIGTDGGGIWRTLDLTGTPGWTPCTDSLTLAVVLKPGLGTVVSLATFPRSGQRIFAATRGGVLWSENGGNVWRLASRQRLVELTSDPLDSKGATLWGHDGARVMESTNSGDTWQPRMGGLPVGCRIWSVVAVELPAGGLRLHAAIEDRQAGEPGTGFWFSDDRGGVWQQDAAELRHREGASEVSPQQIGAIRFATIEDRTMSHGLYAAIARRADGHMLDVVKRVAGDDRWRSASGAPNAGGLPTGIDFAHDFAQPMLATADGRLFLGGFARILVGTERVPPLFESHDQGGAWASAVGSGKGVHPHVDAHAFTCHQGRVFQGNDGGVFGFDAVQGGGAGQGSWKSLNTIGLQTHLLRGASLHPTQPFSALVASQDNGTALRQFPKWSKVSGGVGDSNFVRFDPDAAGNGNYAYQAGPPDPDPHFFFRSGDGGKTFVSKGFARPELVPFGPIFAIHERETSRLVAGLGRVYETSDRGDSWGPISPVFVGANNPASAITYGPDAGTIYVAYGVRMFATPDRGLNWNECAPRAGGTDVVGITVDPEDADRVFVACTNGRLWRSVDAGGQWLEITGNFPWQVGAATILARRLGNGRLRIYLGTSVGPWYAQDLGENTAWARYGHGFPDVRVTDLCAVSNPLRVIAATYGRGAFVARGEASDELSVSISEDRDNCGVGTVAGSTGRYVAHPVNSVGTVEYEWSAEVGVITGASNLPEVRVIAPSSGTFAVNLVVRDSRGEEAAARRFGAGVPPDLADLLWRLCQLRGEMIRVWADPLWDPIKERPMDRRVLLERVALTQQRLDEMSQHIERLRLLE